MKQEKPIIDMSQLGFKTAFKATMGYHLANILSFIIGSTTLILVVSAVVLVFKALNK